MKPKNKQKKLASRIKDWENMKYDDMDGPKIKKINKSAFRKPGSVNK